MNLYMKKKNIISLFAGAALLFSFPACTDLDEEVYDSIAAEDFGATSTEVKALVGTVYKTVKNYVSDGAFFALEEMCGTSNVTPTRYGGDWYDSGQYRELYMHTWTSETSVIKSAWENASSGIGTCNANYQVVEASEVITDDVKTEYLAEIRGVRAFWYYKMMDLWGNVPLVTDYDDKELPTNATRQEVFDFVIDELEDIAEDCPDATTDNYSKFTKGAAYTLLAKMALNAEAWGVSYSGNAYEDVITYCDKVIAYGYTLNSDFNANFDNNNEGTNEAIFAIPFSESDTSYDNRWQMMNRTLHYKDSEALGTSNSAWNGVCAQPEYVHLFENADGTIDPRREDTYLIGLMYSLETGEVIMTDHGYELNHTIDYEMIEGTEYDGTTWGSVHQHVGARCIKWDYSTTLTDAMGNDFYLFRLADIYLMKAEAIIRNGGSGSEAASYVNLVRERAYGDSDHDYSTVGLDEILLERRLELAWEYMNRQDDIRFGEFEYGMWEGSNSARSTGDYLYLFPVSQDAWQSNPNLVQNDGYASF